MPLPRRWRPGMHCCERERAGQRRQVGLHRSGNALDALGQRLERAVHRRGVDAAAEVAARGGFDHRGPCLLGCDLCGHLFPLRDGAQAGAVGAVDRAVDQVDLATEERRAPALDRRLAVRIAVADAAADELFGAEFRAEALQVRLDRAQHLQQLAVGEVHASGVVGDAYPGVQVVQPLQHEAGLAQLGVGLGLARGQARLRGLQCAQQRSFGCAAGRFEAVRDAAFAQRLHALQRRLQRRRGEPRDGPVQRHREPRRRQCRRQARQRRSVRTQLPAQVQGVRCHRQQAQGVGPCDQQYARGRREPPRGRRDAASGAVMAATG